MSVWTHVTGSIMLETFTLQVSTIPFSETSDKVFEEKVSNIESTVWKILGDEDIEQEQSPKNTIMFWGSEAPIHWAITKRVKIDSDGDPRLYDMVISLYGDLRDVNEEEKDFYNSVKLYDWWKNIIKELNQKIGVRIASLYVETEYGKGHTYTYNLDRKFKVMK